MRSPPPANAVVQGGCAGQGSNRAAAGAAAGFHSVPRRRVPACRGGKCRPSRTRRTICSFGGTWTLLHSWRHGSEEALQRMKDDTRLRDGRDELNLADFPISVLQRQQPTDADGKKLDSAVYEAGRFDRTSRQRVEQKVILETSSRHGLPTPADE